MPSDVKRAADLARYLKSAEKARKALNRKMDAIYTDDSLSISARNLKLNPLQKKRAEVYLEFNKRFIKEFGAQAE